MCNLITQWKDSSLESELLADRMYFFSLRLGVPSHGAWYIVGAPEMLLE